MLKEALELHSHLNPAIWDKDWNLLPEVEDRIYKIVNKFQSECMLPLDIVDVHLVGSNASFNYNSQSDLDVHIVVNFDLLDVDKEILTAAYNLQKAQFNRDYDISIHGINIEMYIEDINSMTASNGIYSLYNKKWIKKPVKKSYHTLDKRFYDTLDRLADKMRKVVSSDDEVEITKNINMLYMMRKNGLATDGEFSIGNLLFKEIRNLGLLDELKQRLKQVQSNNLTLEHLCEDDGIAINENNSMVYYTSSDIKIDSFDESKSKEVGLHCGTKEQAIKKGGRFLYEIKLKSNTRICHLVRDDGSDYGSFSFLSVLKDSDLITKEELLKLSKEFRNGMTGDPEKDKFVLSKRYREFFKERGFDAFDYPNYIEGNGEPSICILSGDVIESIKEIGTSDFINEK